MAGHGFAFPTDELPKGPFRPSAPWRRVRRIVIVAFATAMVLFAHLLLESVLMPSARGSIVDTALALGLGEQVAGETPEFDCGYRNARVNRLIFGTVERRGWICRVSIESAAIAYDIWTTRNMSAADARGIGTWFGMKGVIWSDGVMAERRSEALSATVEGATVATFFLLALPIALAVVFPRWRPIARGEIVVVERLCELSQGPVGIFGIRRSLYPCLVAVTRDGATRIVRAQKISGMRPIDPAWIDCLAVRRSNATLLMLGPISGRSNSKEAAASVCCSRPKPHAPESRATWRRCAGPRKPKPIPIREPS